MLMKIKNIMNQNILKCHENDKMKSVDNINGKQ